MKEFTLVTGNPGKWLEAERILGFRPDVHELDLPEIQSLDVHEVLRAKADEAWRKLRRPVVVDETALDLAALNGFPGPLVKWMLEAVGAAGIAATAHALGNPRATAWCVLLYRDAETSIVAEGRIEGRLTTEPRGDEGFGWDFIFMPEGRDKTYAELSPAIKDETGHRGLAWRRLRQALEDAGL